MSNKVVVISSTVMAIFVFSIVITSLLYIRSRRVKSVGRYPRQLTLASKNPEPESQFASFSPCSLSKVLPCHKSSLGYTPDRDIFHHEPGKHMLVAKLAPDGYWVFNRPGQMKKDTPSQLRLSFAPQCDSLAYTMSPETPLFRSVKVPPSVPMKYGTRTTPAPLSNLAVPQSPYKKPDFQRH